MSQARPKASVQGYRGFTLIEILIVIAIAGLILLVIFLIVPTVQRSARNHNRKVAVGYTSASLNEYKSNGGTYPLTASQDERTAFVNGLKNSGPTKIFNIVYGTNYLSHEYPYDSPEGPENALDEVIIIPAHRCNRSPNVGPGDVDYPAQAIDATDSNYNVYAVYALLEAQTGTPRAYCLDSVN